MTRLTRIIVALLIGCALLFGGLAATTPAATAATSHPCFATPVKQNGPGLKNWRAYDPWCTGGGAPGHWYGPWRYTKGGAWIDAERHNAFND